MLKLLLLSLVIGTAMMPSTPRPVHLPLMMTNAPDPLRPATIRIDDIPLSQLDAELKKLGIPADLRQEIIKQEQERRENPPQQLQPQTTPDGNGLWVGTGCAAGQGCTMTWNCAGICQGQWFEISGGPTEWVGFPCPVRLICTMISRVPSIPIPRHHWIAFRGFSGFGMPIYVIWQCFWQA